MTTTIRCDRCHAHLDSEDQVHGIIHHADESGDGKEHDGGCDHCCECVAGPRIVSVTVRGRALWRSREYGARGAVHYLYAQRRPGAQAPNGWELWSECARDAGGVAAPAGTYGHIGLGWALLD